MNVTAPNWSSATTLLQTATPQEFVDALDQLCAREFASEQVGVVLVSGSGSCVARTGSPALTIDEARARPPDTMVSFAEHAEGLTATWTLDADWHLQLSVDATSKELPRIREQLRDLAPFVRHAWDLTAKRNRNPTTQRAELRAQLQMGHKRISQACHDMRTPLHSISLASQLLQMQATEKTQPLVERIVRNVGQLNTLVEDLASTDLAASTSE